jgi:glutamyl-tRNA synthetase
MSDAPPRLRFAPSPTGFFHVGGARTALFNWLVARQTGGVLVLRIEDTDTERNQDEWVEGIQSAMRWIGVDWDEGPFFQSQRGDLYAAAITRLFAEGLAYYCTCSADDVRLRNSANFGAAEADRGYDGYCRTAGLTAGAVRFRTPDEGTTVVTDLIRGTPEFENSRIEDFIIQRSNGGVMFLLANVVDDIDMRISHVVRGEEHLPNTPRALLLWQALAPGVDLPVFAHVPVLVNEKRQKLSKRRDRVALEDFRDLGILPDAMRNYLVLLGWSMSDDRELVSVQTMIDEFRLEDVNASPAFFDIVKLTAMNAEYVRMLSVDDFIERCRPFVPAAWADSVVLRHMAPMLQERVRLLPDVATMIDFFFDAPVMEPDAWIKTMTGSNTAGAHHMIEGFIAAASSTPWLAEDLKLMVERVGASAELKLGKAQAPIRVAVTGRTVGPPLFEALELLGVEETIHRLRVAKARLD